MRAHPISIGVLVLNDPAARGLARRLSNSNDEINAAAAGLTLVPTSTRLELTLPLSAQIKVIVSPT
jgi:hypothetical protein